MGESVTWKPPETDDEAIAFLDFTCTRGIEYQVYRSARECGLGVAESLRKASDAGACLMYVEYFCISELAMMLEDQ